MEHFANLFIRSVFLENMALAFFLGMCSFLACSKKVDTALGLGVAVVFVQVLTVPLNNLILRYLLAEGANMDAVSPNGTSALMMAVRENRLSTVELLIARGVNVNLRNENGASALDWATRNNDAVMVALLKKAGARD
jgi:Na+-transporting NADH:ubiquinone oxidoreductase subunit NqrE